MTDDAVAQALDAAVRAAFLLGVNWQGGAEEEGVQRATAFSRAGVLPVLDARIDQAVEEAALVARLARYRRGRRAA